MKIFFVFIASLFLGAHIPKENSVTVFSVEKKEGIELYGKNINYYPVTIELDLNLTNMSSSNKNPIVAIIDGRSEIKLTDLKVNKENASWGMKYNYTFYQGSIYAKHSRNFGYKLPYKKGESYRLDQGYGGKFSHRGDSKYSLDFQMELGTEIYAARAGVVVEIEERYSEGGNDRSS